MLVTLHQVGDQPSSHIRCFYGRYYWEAIYRWSDLV